MVLHFELALHIFSGLQPTERKSPLEKNDPQNKFLTFLLRAIIEYGEGGLDFFKMPLIKRTLPQNGLRLTTETGLLGIVSSPTLSHLGLSRLLVLGDL